MKQKLKTTLAFTKNLFTTGAFMETSEKVEKEICKHLSPEENTLVVEYGMGHGNITKNILKHISKTSRVYAFEVNPDFCDFVRKAIPDDRLTIIQDSAENVKNHIKQEVDSVISSIPFSFLSKHQSQKILADSYELMRKGSYFSQVLYTKFNFKKFVPVFDQCEIIRLKHFPTEYIYHCLKNGKGKDPA
jgi:phospholipid N-methyltransferase